MSLLISSLCALAICLILWDSFEALLMPRRVTRPYRYTRLFYNSSWTAHRWLAMRLTSPRRRAALLSLFGPLSLLVLLATWSLGLVLAFAIWQWGWGESLRFEAKPTLFEYFYLSGVTFLTLGYGDITASSHAGRLLCVAEAGVGFGFLAMVISYLPTLWQAFESRELSIGLLDARAGSPPAAGQLLTRMCSHCDPSVLDGFFKEWEVWAAQTLESHLSFPVLSYYRSQHDNQSWLIAITSVLDACTLLIASAEGRNPYQAQLTFAMARHLLVDLNLVFRLPLVEVKEDRFAPEKLAKLRTELAGTKFRLSDGPAFDAKIAELRHLYEPFAYTLAEYLAYDLPPVWPDAPRPDNWQTSAGQRRAAPFNKLALPVDEHFE